MSLDNSKASLGVQNVFTDASAKTSKQLNDMASAEMDPLKTLQTSLGDPFAKCN